MMQSGVLFELKWSLLFRSQGRSPPGASVGAPLVVPWVPRPPAGPAPGSPGARHARQNLGAWETIKKIGAWETIKKEEKT